MHGRELPSDGCWKGEIWWLEKDDRCVHTSLPFPLFPSSIASLNSHFSSFSPSHHSFISLKSNITQHYLATNMPAFRTRKEKAEFQPYSRKKDQEIKDQGVNTNVGPSLTSCDIQLT